MMTTDVLITIKGLQMAMDDSDSLEIMTNGKYYKKNGKHYVQMFFETGKKNTSIYSTPFGQIEIGIYAEQIRVNESENKLELNMQYDLEMNSEHVSDSQVSVTVVSR